VAGLWKIFGVSSVVFVGPSLGFLFGASSGVSFGPSLGAFFVASLGAFLVASSGALDGSVTFSFEDSSSSVQSFGSFLTDLPFGPLLLSFCFWTFVAISEDRERRSCRPSLLHGFGEEE